MAKDEGGRGRKDRRIPLTSNEFLFSSTDSLARSKSQTAERLEKLELERSEFLAAMSQSKDPGTSAIFRVFIDFVRITSCEMVMRLTKY